MSGVPRPKHKQDPVPARQKKNSSRSAFTSCPVQDGNGTSYALAQELSNLKLEHRSSAQVKLSSCTKLSPCKITAETGMAAPLLSPVS